MTTMTAPSAQPSAATSPARPSPATACAIRPLEPGDGLEIRRLFRATFGPRRPHGLEYADLVSYERSCIDWYLTIGRADARVVEQEGEIVGYLLACLDQSGHDAWSRRRAVRWAGRAAYRLATGQLGGDARRFSALHIEDLLAARQLGNPRPFPAHAHLHIAASARDAGIGHRLVTTMDDLVEREGLRGWYGQVDVPVGGSLGPFERSGVRIVHHRSNRTSSWTHGTPVHRVTVARSLADRSTHLGG